MNFTSNTNTLTRLEDVVHLLIDQSPRCISNHTYCNNKGLGLIREGPAASTADIDVRVGEKVM